MSQKNQNIEIDWEKIPGCTGNIYDTDPRLAGWMLTHGPPVPGIEKIKNKVFVYKNTKGNRIEAPENQFVKDPSYINTQGMESQLEGGLLTRIIQTVEPQTAREPLTRIAQPVERQPGSSPAARTAQSVEQQPARENKRQRRVLPAIEAAKSGSQSLSPNKRVIKSNDLYNALSPEQKEVHDFVTKQKKNVFYSGSAGTGKSVLLRSIISTFETRFRSDEIAVTASTGVAAVNINGITVHSFAGIGIGDKDAKTYIRNIVNNNMAKTDSIRRTKVFIVDEISMIDAELLDMIDNVVRGVRSDPRPFGGMQVIFCGDFYQLPPVKQYSDSSNTFAFKASCWDKTVDKVFLLRTPFRQKDKEFADMLNEIRIGKISAKTEAIFKKLARPLKNQDNILPTQLYPLRSEVDRANSLTLSKLPGEEHVFIAEDTGFHSEMYLKDCKAPKELVLKVGSQVMLLKNLSVSLVNGSIGVVEGFHRKFENSKELPVVKFTNGEKRTMMKEDWETEIAGKLVANRSQIPLMLAWAISIHKSQGQTIDFMQVDLAKIFETGQAYVALSRGASLENMQVLNFNTNRVKVHSGVAEFYNQLN